MNFNKIAHLADIHIRLYKRHGEYREVFSELYSQLRKEAASGDLCIVIAGDILHAKTEMSPEMVDLASEFFVQLSKIAPTVIIAGNHDLNLANRHRLDALTPIVQNMGLDNLYYLKSSGIHTIGNINFYNDSLIDNLDEVAWYNLITEHNVSSNVEHDVGLYHGPLHSAVTDSGYVVESHKYSMERLGEYCDIVLLGDIHKHQKIEFVGPRYTTPFVYAGSLIQQNHGENIAGHGWVLWNLRDYSYEHRTVPNRYGYVTIRLNGDGTFDIPKDMPPKVRIQIIAEDVNPHDLRKFVQMVKLQIKPEEVTINQTNAIERSKHVEMGGFDVSDVAVQNSLITNYALSVNPNTPSGILDELVKINVESNKMVSEDSIPLNIHWRPLKLTFDNLFAYGEGNEIRFDTMGGLYGIFATNARGKSSAMEALAFALYDKTPRAFKGSHIMNNRCNEMYCKLEFMINSTEYTIERTGKRKPSGDVAVEVNFYRMEGNTPISLNATDRRSTNAEIRKYIGTYEDFIMTALSTQNQNSLFVDIGQTDRKALLGQYIGLTMFEKLHEVALEVSKQLFALLRRHDGDDVATQLATLRDELSENGDHETRNGALLQLERAKSADLKTESEKISAKIESIKSQYPDMTPVSDEEIRLLEDEIIEYGAKNKQTQEAIETAKSSLVSTNAELEKQIQAYETEYADLDSLESDIEQVKADLEEARAKRANVENLLVSVNHIVTRFDGYEYDPDCKFCVANSGADELPDAQEKLPIYHAELEVATARVKELLAKLSHLSDTMRKKHSDQLDISKTRETLVGAEAKLAKMELKYVDGRKELDSRIARRDAIIAMGQKRVELLSLHNGLAEVNAKRGRVANEIAKLEDVSVKLEARYLYLRGEIDRLNKLNKEYDDISRRYAVYENYLSIVGKNGLPYELVERVIPKIELETNNILNQVVDFTVKLEVDDKYINAYLVYDDDRVWALDLASGMERFVSGLAIRVALNKISNLPKPNFLIIDEGFGVLDAENRSQIQTMLEILKSNYDFVIVISHLEAMRDMVDETIEIERRDDFSHINC